MLYLFLQRNYEHTGWCSSATTSAKEVTEGAYSPETGTIVPAPQTDPGHHQGLPGGRVEPVGAQASDGDNWNDDSPPACWRMSCCHACSLLYVEVMRSHQALWDQYQGVMERNGDFFMAQIDAPGDIYPVFRRLFKKRMEAA